MRNEVTCVLFLVCSGLGTAAVAATTSEEVGRIEAETAILKARAHKVEVQAQITARQADIAARQADMRRMAQAPAAGDPIVHGVEGIGDTVYATLQFPNGREMEVKTGDTLPNGSTVISVRANEVIVQNAQKRRVRLANGGRALPSAPSPYAAGGMPVPALSQVPPLAGATQ